MSKVIDHNRNSVLDAIYVLNDIIDNLVASTMVFDRYQKQYELGQFSQLGIVAVQKMCVTQLVLGLSKLIEFWEHYHQVIPSDLQPELKSTLSTLKKRDLQRYRNSVIAHIWDKKLGRTQTQLEAYEQLNRISGDSPKLFLKWINDPDGNTYPDNLVSIVETLMDRLRQEHNVSSDEVLKR